MSAAKHRFRLTVLEERPVIPFCTVLSEEHLSEAELETPAEQLDTEGGMVLAMLSCIVQLD